MPGAAAPRGWPASGEGGGRRTRGLRRVPNPPTRMMAGRAVRRVCVAGNWGADLSCWRWCCGVVVLWCGVVVWSTSCCAAQLRRQWQGKDTEDGVEVQAGNGLRKSRSSRSKARQSKSRQVKASQGACVQRGQLALMGLLPRLACLLGPSHCSVRPWCAFRLGMGPDRSARRLLITAPWPATVVSRAPAIL